MTSAENITYLLTGKEKKRQDLTNAITDIFISAKAVEEMIEDIIDLLGKYLEADSIAIATLQNNNLHIEYSRDSHSSHISPEPPLSPDDFSRHGLIFEAEDFSEEASTRNADSTLVTYPIYVDKLFWGLLLIYRQAGLALEDEDIRLLKRICNIISGVLRRHGIWDELLRMSHIVDSSPLFICAVNRDGTHEGFNASASKMTGYTREELIEGNIDLCFSPENARHIREVIVPQVREGATTEFEMPIIRKDGQERILHIDAFPIQGPRGGYAIIASDITDFRTLEAELVEARERAEEASRSKSDFLSRMSHEIRTPMNAIIGMSHIARSSDDPVKKDYCLSKIDSASKHLLGIINDILDMAKIESGKLELSETEFSLEYMLIDVSNLIQYKMDEKHLNYIVNIDKDVPGHIVADEQHLSQVLVNLLSNASKFTLDGGTVTLRVGLLRREGKDCILSFEVEDTGIGITKEQQKKLFQPFEQADGSISRKFGGTGLGLVISKQIVELMDGEISVRSTPGEGSVFSFYIRAGEGAPRQNAPLKHEQWKHLKVLAVDDAPEIRTYFEEIAPSIGFTCHTAASGEEALTMLSRTRYDIIFIDWIMPGMDGARLSRLIKEKYGDNIVIIMISGAQWSDIASTAKVSGVDGFIPKPLFAATIVECIQDKLEARQNSNREEPPTKGPADYTGQTMLLAEDIQINREIVRELLSDTGIEIVEAVDGQMAVDKFLAEPQRYSIVLMDVQMPNLDGYEATRQIRASGAPNARTIPILAMTANVFRQDIQRCLDAGMNDHIGKPVEYQTLLDKIDIYLRVPHSV